MKERIKSIYRSKSATLSRSPYCWILTLGNQGPFYYGTVAGLRAGLERRKKLVPLSTLADLSEKVTEEWRKEQQARAKRAFAKVGTIIILALALVSPARADLVESLLPLVRMAESSGDPSAVGNGSWGLYQISQPVLDDFNRIHGEEIVVEDLFDPQINERIARWYLRWLNDWLTRHGYPDDVQRLVFTYNSGLGRLRRNNFEIPIWTRDHPNRIYRAIYRGTIEIGKMPGGE